MGMSGLDTSQRTSAHEASTAPMGILGLGRVATRICIFSKSFVLTSRRRRRREWRLRECYQDIHHIKTTGCIESWIYQILRIIGDFCERRRGIVYDYSQR